jgi:hypothetical protein
VNWLLAGCSTTIVMGRPARSPRSSRWRSCRATVERRPPLLETPRGSRPPAARPHAQPRSQRRGAESHQGGQHPQGTPQPGPPVPAVELETRLRPFMTAFFRASRRLRVEERPTRPAETIGSRQPARDAGSWHQGGRSVPHRGRVPTNAAVVPGHTPDRGARQVGRLRAECLRPLERGSFAHPIAARSVAGLSSWQAQRPSA